ncbi:hypothetical protein J4422_04655 [Candidatus Pacearchaeota archaeon]|nr:hypothetical protein [Candidatus Pacearchaeota archaeon]
MNYITNRISYNQIGTSNEVNSYEIQKSLYERAIKYSRAAPTGEYKGDH